MFDDGIIIFTNKFYYMTYTIYVYNSHCIHFLKNRPP